MSGVIIFFREEASQHIEYDGIASRISADIASSIAPLLQLVCATGI
jgi:hypothetical protein